MSLYPGADFGGSAAAASQWKKQNQGSGAGTRGNTATGRGKWGGVYH